MTEREIHQSTYMTETEALMWAAESDPWLSAGMGSLFLLDAAPDFERFAATIHDASFTLRRLRERVVEGFGLAPPRWVIDDDFDITDHIRHVQLPNPGGVEQVLELAAQVFQDPFDTSRPLWEFVAVSGPAGRKSASKVPGAIIMKLHHSVSDGIGALRLAEMYLDLERDPKVSRSESAPVATDSAATESSTGLRDDFDHVAKKQLELTRKVAAEVALWGADLDRPKRLASTGMDMVRAAAGQRNTSSSTSGSSAFRTRSRQRHLEVFDLPLDSLKNASKTLGGSVNDVFVTGSLLGVKHYHQEIGSDLGQFNLSFVLSTRADDAAAGNAFTPIPFSVDSDFDSIEELFAATQAAMGKKRDEILDTPVDALNLVAGVASLLPKSLLTKAGRARAATQDWATSNLRGAPFPIFTAGAEITHMYPIGPVAGTAFNLTAMSYSGTLHFGCFLDPRAVSQPRLLRTCLQAGYESLLQL